MDTKYRTSDERTQALELAIEVRRQAAEDLQRITEEQTQALDNCKQAELAVQAEEARQRDEVEAEARANAEARAVVDQRNAEAKAREALKYKGIERRVNPTGFSYAGIDRRAGSERFTPPNRRSGVR